MDLIQYISKDALVIIPILWAIGYVLKSTPKINNWLIPYILGLVGIGLSVGILGIHFQSVVQGLLVSMASVGTHQVLIQGLNQN